MKQLTRRHLLGIIAGTAAVATAPALMGRGAIKTWAIRFPADADPQRVAEILWLVKNDGRKLFESGGMSVFPIYNGETAQPTGEHIAYVLL